jgi:hypothetical protein
MKQMTFPFFNKNNNQLELFPNSYYDDRVGHLTLAMKLMYKTKEWDPYNINRLVESSNSFGVLNETVLNVYDKVKNSI